jgi:hypothetical protein
MKYTFYYYYCSTGTHIFKTKAIAFPLNFISLMTFSKLIVAYFLFF